MVAKLSSASTMSATFLVTSVPVMPIPTPMSARLMDGRVVDAVARHGDDLVARLPGLDDAGLVLGLDTGVHAVILDVRVELLVAHVDRAPRR